MSIYIGTIEAGKPRIAAVSKFAGVEDLRAYADEVLASTNTIVPARATVRECCELLEDRGPGFGSRTHTRLYREEALQAIREGAKEY